jgi:DNA modification methylase
LLVLDAGALLISGAMETNVLYYGDNLDILRRYIPAESVDLVYLDPPFNSNRTYSAIFADESGRKSDAQIHAFEDSWHWGPTPEAHLAYLKNSTLHQGKVPVGVSQLLAALEFGIGKTPMLAYLVEMAVRLIELHRVLKPTGSLYLHCDPTASHYLKIVLDAIFGPQNFRNEIIWKRSSAHSDTGQGARHYGRVSDTILFYAMGDANAWNQQYAPYDDHYVAENYKRRDPDGRLYRIDNIQGPGGAAKGNPSYEFLGVTRWWRFSKVRMQQLYDEGRIIQTKPGAVPQYKRYLDEMPGLPIQNIWTDIPVINNRSKEMLGYPTQKPAALLDRIISTSSNPGDVVLDPFCGCGTALVAAQKLGRRWIGIDITYLAVGVMRRRLQDSFPGLPPIRVEGQPTEVEGARLLATQVPEGRYQFQWWALDEVGALPASGDHKKGSDTGIDGRITFTGADGGLLQALVSVKSGKPKADDVRVLKAVCEREGAAIGIMVTLDEPTKPMQHEATIAGTYHSDVSGKDYPRIQILSVADLLERGLRPQLPPLVSAPLQRAGKVIAPVDQATLFGGSG